MYGMTELASWVAGDLKRTQGYKESAFDLPWNAEVKIVKETGEIWIKSPSLISGYFNDPEATEKSVENGWFKTGDVFHDGSHSKTWVHELIAAKISDLC